MVNLSHLLIRHRESAELAITGDLGRLSYRRFYRHVGAAREHLSRLGIGEGDRLALSLPNITAMPVYYFAALSLGAICVPLNPLLTERELRFHLDDSGAALLIIGRGARALQDGATLEGIRVDILSGDRQLDESPQPWQPLEVTDDTPAVLLYTSGTTGKPKGAVLTHGNLWANATTVARVFDYRGTDVLFGGLPLFHSFGQTVSMNAVFAAGAAVALLPRFSPEAAARLCVESGVSVIAAVPSMYTAIAAYLETRTPQELAGKIRFGISGGSPLPASAHSDFMRLLNCPVLEGYGLSEASPVVSFNRPGHPPVLGSVGTALDGVKVQVRNDEGAVLAPGSAGQLWVAGANVMAGYWKDPEATAAIFDGDWLATGDIARIDGDGNIFIVDRIKDMILRNGYSVYPREIEDVIDSHASVRQVAVVGIASKSVGEEVCAVVVPRERLSPIEQEKLVAELDELCRTSLAAYKYPRQFRIVDTLPLGATGKVLKWQLRSSGQEPSDR